ncbi:uncharacterized protein At4g18490 isoform X3 [Eutrema salsugineum]|uniref:uncharacterized protein At4g18490 isoform X3 n=1 Tax=Eutrema salsugineum TaxID=72664 RepID=UPI000CED6AB9|nr:uncharacterized protein At4g18490 isoform X3 [Eutrema salsugineum]
MSAPAKKSSTEAQENDLMLDKDMEKDTWNFKSMTDDDPMDFGFEPPGNKKKNAFKLDMGFDLDGDFGNLSSFKMDMPDFDFSSPAKKTTKTKESSDDKSSGNLKQKKNPFAFSYDFDALDDFDLDSSPTKKGSETATKTMGSEEISGRRKFDKSDSLDFGPDLPTTTQATSMEYTDVKAKASAEKENLLSKTTDTMVVDSSPHSKQATQECMETSEAVESPQGIRTKTSMCLQPRSVKTSPLKTSCAMVEDIKTSRLSNETAAPSPLHASETAHAAENRETSPDSHEICRSNTKEDCPREPEQNANNEMISTMDSRYEKTEQTTLNISSQLCLEMVEHQQEEMSTGTPANIQDHTRRTLCDPDAGESQTTLSGKVSPGTRLSQTHQVRDSSVKLPQDPSHSVPGLNDSKAMQNKDAGLIRSKFFKKAEKPQPHVLESSAVQTEIRPVTRERIGLNLNPTNDRRHENKDALPGSETRTCPSELVKTDSETANVNISSSSHEKVIHKDHSNAKPAENVAGMMDHLKLQAKNTTREKSILQINISSKLDASSLTQKLSKHLGSGAESLQKSKIASLERPKLGNFMSDLRAAKTQRTIGVNKDQPSSAVQPEVSSSISKERNTEAPVKKSSEIHHFVPKDKKQTLQCPSSLKRKALDEEADRSLKPQLKRFSMSPRENRNVEELTHRVAQGKFSSQESKTDNNISKELVRESPQPKSHHQIINMANMEIPVTENADNIEKAEAYTKELDNICNILKKKHEEAKELLVRAVVNNNKLLMLNHPLYEDKIRMIQKFAAKLTIRDTQTTLA